MGIGERLRQERHRRHLSQKALAEALSISVQSISRWEREETIPQAHYRLQLSQFFDIHPEELFQDLPIQGQQHSTPAAPAIWSVPYPRNPYFTGRVAVLQQIATVLHTSQMGTVTRPQAITGLGGIGKTQIALEYAYRFDHDYDAILWIQAETYEILLADLVALADVLQLPEAHHEEDIRIVEVVKQWLRTHTRWLLILDNVEDIAQVHHLDLPRTNGHLLLTTHSQFTGSLAERIELDSLPEDEGSLFLLHRSKLLPLDLPLEAVPELLLSSTQQLFQVLGGLPLALDQAGAYIDEAGCSISDYLQHYEHQYRQLLNRRGVVGKDHPRSVAATLLLSYEQVARLNPVAMEVLRLCSFLHPDYIPEEIITAGISSLGVDMPSASTASYQLDEVFVTLRSFSLVIRHAETHAFSLHHLVQVVIRDTMESTAVHQWLARAVQAINAVFPEEGFAPWTMYERYIPHVQTCILLGEQAGIVIPEMAQMLEKTGNYVLKRGRSLEAMQFLQRAFAIHEALSGPDSPESIKILQSLATLSCKQEKDE